MLNYSFAHRTFSRPVSLSEDLIRNVSLSRTTHLALARHHHSAVVSRLRPGPIHPASPGRRRRLPRRRRPRNSRPPRLGHPPRKQHPPPRKSPASLLGHCHRHQALRRPHMERPPLPPPQRPCPSLLPVLLRPPLPDAAIRLLGRRSFPRLVRTVSLHAHLDSRRHRRPLDRHRPLPLPRRLAI